jgi:hypothetical protein
LLSSVISAFSKVASAKGYTSNLDGDKSQLGGTVLLGRGGSALYVHRQTAVTFEPDLKKIAEALGEELGDDFVYYQGDKERPRWPVL